MLKKMRTNKKGFTLAELLVVLAIVAILVAIAIPAFSVAQQNAQNAVYEANARSAHAEAMVNYMSGADKDTNADNDNDNTTFTAVFEGVTYNWTLDVAAGTATVAVTATDANPASYTFDVSSAA